VETVRLLENLVQTLPFLGSLLAAVRLLAGVVPRAAGEVGPWAKAVNSSFAGRVAGLDPHTELAAELADYFAADLRAVVTRPDGPPRVALFLDGLDGFWSRADEFTPYYFHALDEWVRRLLLGLFREGPSGVVVVAASRKPPTWERASPFPVPRKVLRPAPLGPLGRADSEEYLGLAGVENAATRRALVDYAWIETDGPTRNGGSGGAHPLLLRLAAEVAQAAPGRSWDASDLDRVLTEAGKVGELLTCLLRFTDRSTGEALQAVAVARSFDQDIYDHLGANLKFETSPARFAKITAMSLCWALPGGPGRFRIHDLVRRLVAGTEAPEENALKAHRSLEAYHRRRLPTSPLAILEVLYHQTYSDEKAAAETWNEDFFDAVERSDLSTCAALLEVWAHVFRRVRGHPRANALSSIAGYLALVSRHDEARGFLVEALAAYSEALALAPRDPTALDSRAVALQRLAHLEAKLGRHDEARGFLVESLAAYSEALALAPRNPTALGNRAGGLRSFADLEANLGRHDAARRFYKEALVAYSEALTLAPRNPTDLGNRAGALLRLADLEAKLGRHDEARGFLVESLEAYSEVLALAPRNPVFLDNRAGALQSLAHLEASLGRHDEARGFLVESLEANSEALALAPRNPTALGNRALALKSLADLEALFGRHDEARGFYRESLAVYSEALALAPQDPAALGDRGSALQRLADLEANLGRHDEARGFYKEALAAYSEALALAPQNPTTLGNRAAALQSLADLAANRGRHDEARGFYEEALAAYLDVLRIVPGHFEAQLFRFLLERRLAGKAYPPPSK
jgi:tetratricopeptide (TPR) repeat protein